MASRVDGGVVDVAAAVSLEPELLQWVGRVPSGHDTGGKLWQQHDLPGECFRLQHTVVVMIALHLLE